MKLNLLKNKTLLYVEDEELIRKNAVEYLSRYCHTVYEAKDGLEGLKMYHTHKPDIIISDINMPHLNGLDFAGKIRATDKATPIIIATAHTQTEYLLKAVELQLIKYIIKPINAQKIEEALLLACDTLDGKYIHCIQLDEITSYDTLNKTLLMGQNIVKLTHNELLFFDFLVKNRQRTITYNEIESLIWAYEGMSMDALRSLVRGLRKKLSNGAANFVENISGVGYRLKTYS